MLSAADYEAAALKVRVCYLVSIGKLSRREEIKAPFKTMSREEQNNLFIWPASSAVSLLFFIRSLGAQNLFSRCGALYNARLFSPLRPAKATS
jgi:hypothetical protein